VEKLNPVLLPDTAAFLFLRAIATGGTFLDDLTQNSSLFSLNFFAF